MCILACILKQCKITSETLLNVQIDLLLVFQSIVNENITHLRKFRVSDCTFRKVKGVDLRMTQSSKWYSTFILTKIYIQESSGYRFAPFQNAKAEMNMAYSSGI